MAKIDPRILENIKLPGPNSRKGDNGRLLVIAGSEQYHGSLLYAVRTAARIVDLIYILTTAENQKFIRKFKGQTAEFIPISYSKSGFRLARLRNGQGGRNDIEEDCILIGPGTGVSKYTYNLVQTVLKSRIRAVLDADALNVLDEKLLKLLHQDVILTPHKGEFERVFKVAAKLTTVRNESIKRNCTIVLKGKVDIVASRDHQVGLNFTGNAGMTKGGTGDVLAGLIAAFFCKNDAFTSAAAGVFINGLAGDELYKEVGPFYNAEDLAEQIPETLWRLMNHK